jgi:hypothetical protein
MHPKTADKLSTIMLEQSLDQVGFEKYLIERKKRRELPSYMHTAVIHRQGSK